MKLNEAVDFFKSLINQVDEKSEIKVYENFIDILSELEKRDLAQEQLQSIEEKLDSLDLKTISENRKKHFKRKMEEFKKYLKDELSLITKGYYTAIGIALGIAFGVAFGAAFDNVGIGITFGMLIGLIIGRNMDVKAEKENRVLETKPNY